VKTISTIQSIMGVESGQALPPPLYGWLDELAMDVLGPTDDPFDTYRLARERRPHLPSPTGEHAQIVSSISTRRSRL
jgi:hypothetical protein